MVDKYALLCNLGCRIAGLKDLYYYQYTLYITEHAFLIQTLPFSYNLRYSRTNLTFSLFYRSSPMKNTASDEVQHWRRHNVFLLCLLPPYTYTFLWWRSKSSMWPSSSSQPSSSPIAIANSIVPAMFILFSFVCDDTDNNKNNETSHRTPYTSTYQRIIPRLWLNYYVYYIIILYLCITPYPFVRFRWEMLWYAARITMYSKRLDEILHQMPI